MYDVTRDCRIIAVNISEDEVRKIINSTKNINIKKYAEMKTVYCGRQQSFYQFFIHDSTPLSKDVIRKYGPTYVEWFNNEWNKVRAMLTK